MYSERRGTHFYPKTLFVDRSFLTDYFFFSRDKSGLDDLIDADVIDQLLHHAGIDPNDLRCDPSEDKSKGTLFSYSYFPPLFIYKRSHVSPLQLSRNASAA
jgi:hypothetical protein